jgi:hypothetical protein
MTNIVLRFNCLAMGFCCASPSGPWRTRCPDLLAFFGPQLDGLPCLLHFSRAGRLRNGPGADGFLIFSHDLLGPDR